MLHFTITNAMRGKIEFDESSRFEFDKLRNSFRTENKGARFSKQYSYAASPYLYCIAPLGAFNIGQTFMFLKKCKELNIKTTIDEKLAKLVKPNLYIDEILNVPNEKFEYRDYQYRLLKSLINMGRGVIVSPTRSGKSLILAGLCHNMLQKSAQNGVKNILIIVPNIQLVQQMYYDFEEYGVDTNIYNIVRFSSEQHKQNKKQKVDFVFKDSNIIITNTQWLMLHGDELPYIDCIITDEVHGVKRKTELSKLIKSVKIPYKFGCTGTLPKDIEDCWEIEGLFGPVVDEIKIKELQEKNVLADVSIYPIKFYHMLKENFRQANTEDEENMDKFELAQAEYKKEAMYLSQFEPSNKIICNIAKGIINQHPNWNALILFDYTDSGNSLFELLDWQNKHYIDGMVSLETRTDIVDKMNDVNGGQITVANCKCFGTGITVKNIQAIILVTCQSSVTKVIQAIGRGLRIEDKPILNVFDMFHNYKYSEKHFNERTALYKKFYGKELNKDYQIKQINL